MEPLTSAGFLIVRIVPRQDWHSPTLLPPRLLSASFCISPQFPGPYSLRWVDASDASRVDAFEKFGVAAPLREPAIAWSTERFEGVFGWPGTFYDVQDALAARRRFCASEDEIVVIGLGLSAGHAEEFLEYVAPTANRPVPMGRSGVSEMISQCEPLPKGGQLLGFELLDVEYGQISHSWLCNQLEVHCFQTLGIRPGAYGLLADLETAAQCCAEVRKDSVGKEPGLWLPWAIVRYA